MAAFFRVFISRWFLSLLAVLILSALLWVWGPTVSVDGMEPFTSELVRLLLIVAMLVFWGLFSRLDARPRDSDAAGDKPGGNQANKPGSKAESAGRDGDLARGLAPEEKRKVATELGFLRREFGNAMRVLRRSAPGLGLGGRWRYQLPWFLLVGDAGAGKSTLLSASGLSFPLGDPADPPPEIERESIWAERVGIWFSDNAVFVEPPADLAEDAASRPVPAAVWNGLLDTIRRTRPRQPMNGIVLPVALPELLGADLDGIRARATRLRQTLRDVRRGLRLRVPVYVVFTKADHLAGFEEFFDAFPRQVRDQVLGITLPLASPSAGTAPLAAYEPEFDALLESLNRRVLERLHREPDLDRRGLAFGFPQQLALAREPLRAFLETLFKVSRYEERPLVRGVYFTSARQGAVPVDLMRRALHGLAPEASRTAAASESRRGYFTTGLLRDVVLKDAALVGIDPAFERRRRARNLAVTVAVVALAVGLAMIWNVNLSDSRALLARYDQGVAEANRQSAAFIEVARPGPQGTDAGAAVMADAQTEGEGSPPVPLVIVSDTDFAGISAPLGTLRRMSDDIAAKVADRPLRTLLGNYRGSQVDAASSDAYAQALFGLLMPRVLLHLERRMTDPAIADRDLYAVLRTYLMLGGQGPLHSESVIDTLASEWGRVLPGRESQATRDALSAHLASLLVQTHTLPALDHDLIAHARDRLAEKPRGERGMELLLALPEVARLPMWRPLDRTGPLGNRVLVRRSGRSLLDGIDGAFTADGFVLVGKPSVVRVAAFLAGESWVLGAREAPTGETRIALDIGDEILQVYAERYAREWENILADVAIMPIRNVAQAGDVLSLLGGAASPLRRFLMAAAQETDLMAAVDALEEGNVDASPTALLGAASAGASVLGGGAAAASARLARASGAGSDIARLAGLIGTSEERLAEQLVTDRFAGLRELVGDAGDGPELTGMMNAFADAAQVFTRLNHGPDPESAILSLLDGSDSGGVPVAVAIANTAISLPDPLGDMVRDLSETIRAVGSQGAQDVIALHWEEEVAPVCRAMTTGRYPMNPSGAQHVTAEDFAELFGPGGILDSFFAEKLEPMVDRRRAPWVWRDGRGTDIGFDPATPQFFERVDAARKAYFPNGAAVPTVRFQLRPRNLDASVDRVVVQIGDQRLSYAHGVREPQPFEWVATDEATVRVTVTPPLRGQPDAITQTGPWALQRFLDEAMLARTEMPDMFDLRLALGTRSATFELISSSVDNPFGRDLLSGLTCPPRL